MRVRVGRGWLTPVGVVVVGLVVFAAAAGPVGFATSGAGLLLAAASTVYAAAALTFLLWERAPRPVVVILLITLALAATAARVADPDGPVIGVFLVMAFAPLRLEGRHAGPVAIASALVFSLQLAQTAQAPLVFVSVVNGGAAFFFLMGWLLRTEAEQRAELEATREAERHAAVLGERARLAREVHDTLAHTLSGLALHTEGMRLLAGARGVDADVGVAIERAHELTRSGLVEARRAVSALHGHALPGLADLPALVEEHRRAGGAVDLAIEGQPGHLDAEAELALYRVAQESLANVRKHAPAATVGVRLRWEPTTAHLLVTDTDPAGPPSTTGTGGYGLTGMAERAALLGGSFTATPTDTGFSVELTLPVSP